MTAVEFGRELRGALRSSRNNACRQARWCIDISKRVFAHLAKMTSLVPDDFPWDTTPPSLAGAQPKLAARLIDGKYLVGLTPTERYGRWEMCEDLAHQLIAKTLSDADNHPENSRAMTLTRIRRGIERKQWTEPLETDWLMRRLRVLLGW